MIDGKMIKKKVNMHGEGLRGLRFRFTFTNKTINFWTGLQDNQDVFAFPEERQKASALFGGSVYPLLQHNPYAIEKAFIIKWLALLSAKVELHFRGFIRKP